MTPKFDQYAIEQKTISALLPLIGGSDFKRNLFLLTPELFTNPTFSNFIKYSISQNNRNLPVDCDQFLFEVVDKNLKLSRLDFESTFSTPVSDTFLNYASQLALNKLQNIGSEKITDLYHKLSKKEGSVDILNEIQNVYSEMLNIGGGASHENFSDENDSFIEDLDNEWANELMGLGRVKIGLDNYDSQYGGFSDGELVILGARPSMGKTSLALTFALGAMKRESKYPVVIFSGEMSAKALRKKLLAMFSFSSGSLDQSFVPLESIIQFKSYELHKENIIHHNQKMKKFFAERMIIIDSIGKDLTFIQKELTTIYNTFGGIDIAFLDYLQIVNLPGKKQRHEEIADVSFGCKVLAAELSFPFVVLAQLNRELERRDNKRPLPSDLKDSGSIEQDADVILFVYRDNVYKMEEFKQKNDDMSIETLLSQPFDQTELIIGKNRNGPTGTVWLNFHKATTKFIDYKQSSIDTSAPTASFKTEVLPEQSTPSSGFDPSIVTSENGIVSLSDDSSVIVVPNDLLDEKVEQNKILGFLEEPVIIMEMEN